MNDNEKIKKQIKELNDTCIDRYQKDNLETFIFLELIYIFCFIANTYTVFKSEDGAYKIVFSLLIIWSAFMVRSTYLSFKKEDERLEKQRIKL